MTDDLTQQQRSRPQEQPGPQVQPPPQVQPAPQPLTLFRDLTVRRGERVLLDRGNLEVSAGSVTVLMGPSGVGKSLLAAAVFGQRPRGAALRVDGRIGAAMARGALVLQHGAGLPHLSVRSNVRLVAGEATAADRRVEDLALPAAARPATLSGGQLRRFATARALAAGRDLLWLDEPAAGLDAAAALELARQLRAEAATRHLTFIISEHRLDFIDAVADRVLLLGRDGALVELPDARAAVEAMRLGSHEGRTTATDSTAADSTEDGVIGDGAIGDGTSGSGATADGGRSGAAGTGAPGEPRTRSQDRRAPPAAAAWGAAVEVLDAWLPARSLPVALWGLTGAVGRTAGCWWRTLAALVALSGVRGVPFHALVSLIFGAIFVLVFELTLPFVDTVAVLERFGPTIIARVAAPFAAILAAAQGGSAGAAWLAQLSAQRELESLRGLGVPVARAVLGPAWLGLALGVCLAGVVFAGGLTAVFAGWIAAVGGGSAGPLIDGVVTRFMADAVPRLGLFAVIVATVTVHVGTRPARDASDVARAITRAIVIGTAGVMLGELALLVLERLA